MKQSFKKSYDSQKLLSPNDIITVIKDPNTFESKTVTISGSVHYPGTYEIKHREELVTDIIKRAGGITIDAYPSASSFSRNNESVRLSFKQIFEKSQIKKEFFSSRWG